MDALRLAHFGVLCAWSGVLLVEFLVESLGHDDAALDMAARIHYWIDILIEIPLVLAVLVTGTLLSAHVWPFTRLHWIKIAAGLVAITLNLTCCGLVVARYRARGNACAVRKLHRGVRLSVIGVPFGAVAAYVGLAYFSR